MRTEKTPSLKLTCDKCHVEFDHPFYPEIFSGPWVGWDATGKVFGTFDSYQSEGFKDIEEKVERLVAEKGFRGFNRIKRAFWETVFDKFSKTEDGTPIKFLNKTICPSCGHKGINTDLFLDKPGTILEIPVIEFDEYLKLSEAKRDEVILGSWVDWYSNNREFVFEIIREDKRNLLRIAVNDKGLWILIAFLSTIFLCVGLIFTDRALLPISFSVLLFLFIVFLLWGNFSNWVASLKALREWYWNKKKG